METQVLGILVVVGLTGLFAALVLQSRLTPRIKKLVLVGLILRVVGSQIYYYLSEWIYGFGDYSNYYSIGLSWGEAWAKGTLDTFSSPYVVEVCCTGFTVRLTGMLLLALGPTVNGAFIVFALFGYIGILAIAVAFGRAFPDTPLERYLVWVIFFPSLWYWPAALGKDALMLGGLGLSVLGFVGRRGRTSWLTLGCGMTVIVAVRPQVAVMVLAAMTAAHWLEDDSTWTVGRAAQGAALAIGAGALAFIASRALGFHMFSPTNIETYLDARSSSSAFGDSAVKGGPVMGLVNVLFRPFPWDVHGLASGIAAVEVAALWAFIAWKHVGIAAFFRAHRGSRFMWFAIVYSVLYVILTGMALGNLGLIARQRVLMYPFLLMFFAGRSVGKRAPREAPAKQFRSRGVIELNQLKSKLEIWRARQIPAPWAGFGTSSP